MNPMTLPDAATLYFWIWELLALVFILTNACLIWRINVIDDRIKDLIREVGD